MGYVESLDPGYCRARSTGAHGGTWPDSEEGEPHFLLFYGAGDGSKE